MTYKAILEAMGDHMGTVLVRMYRRFFPPTYRLGTRGVIIGRGGPQGRVIDHFSQGRGYDVVARYSAIELREWASKKPPNHMVPRVVAVTPER